MAPDAVTGIPVAAYCYFCGTARKGTPPPYLQLPCTYRQLSFQRNGTHLFRHRVFSIFFFYFINFNC